MAIQVPPSTLINLKNGASLEYYEVGEGEPLVLVNGTTEHFWMWAPQVPGFAEKYRVIMYNHRGIGKSPRGTGTMTVRSLADDLDQLMDALHVDRAHVLGWSLGSAVTQELAINHPNRVASALLFATWGKTDGFLGALIAAMRHPWKTGDRDIALATLGLGFSREALESVEFMRLMSDVEPLMPSSPSQIAAVYDQWCADMAHDSYDRLPQIAAPTLVIGAEQDILCPPHETKRVAATIPNAEHHLFTGPGSSHAVQWERPMDFLAVVLEFLARHPMARA